MEILEREREAVVFQVTEIDLEYEFDAARWYDFSREESPLESRAAELWFDTAHSYPPSPFAIKLLMMKEISIVKTESSALVHREQPQYLATAVNETGNGIRSGGFTFIQDTNFNKVPNHSLNKGPTFSNGIHTDKLKCRPTRPIPRISTLMKPTASQLAKQENIRLHMQVDQIKENGLSPSSVSEVQAAKRQKLDGGLLRKVAETKQEMNLVHKALKKDGTLDRNSKHARTKITIPQEPDFATSHRANRIRHKDDSKLDQDSTSVYRFKARPLNRKIFEAPSLPIRKKSTPKLPEFQEFRLKTSERAMQHSSAVSTGSYQANSYDKGSDKPDTTAFLDGVNREPRRPRAKDDDSNHICKARLGNNKILSSCGEIGIFRKSKPETTIPLTQTQESSFLSEKRFQPDLPTDLFSKLSLTSELQPNGGGSHSRFAQPEQVKRTSKVTARLMVPETSRQWTARRSVGIH